MEDSGGGRVWKIVWRGAGGGMLCGQCAICVVKMDGMQYMRRDGGMLECWVGIMLVSCLVGERWKVDEWEGYGLDGWIGK